MTASAQVFRLGRWEGAVEGRLEYSHQNTTTGGQESAKFEDLRGEERLTLRNVGAFVIDPRLATLTLGGTFGLSQERQSFDGTSDTTTGHLYGYEAFLGILSEEPYSLNLYANRDQEINGLVFGGRTEDIQENRGGTFYARGFIVPSSVGFRQEVLNEETRTGEVVARRDETRNILTYEGNRGWENSEASLRYEFTDLTDRVFTDLSYQSHDGSLNYNLEFGPELNWRWDSSARFFRRTGNTELTTETVDETLRIDHTERLQSNYRYLLVRTDTPEGATTSNTGEFDLRHRLYESLTTDFRLDTIITNLPGGQKDTYRGRLDFAYEKRLPMDGRLNIGLGGGMQYDDNRFHVQETLAPQETHTLLPSGLPIQLSNPFVVAGSIVVTKTAVGPLPAGCIAPSGPPTPLVLGQDYTLTTVGDITQIVPIPCVATTPGINPGDTIAVDYQFAVPTSLAFTTATWHADASVDYRWIRPYASSEGSEQTLVSGTDGQFLDDVRSHTVGTELRYDGSRLHASLLGEGRRYTSQRISYNTARSAQFASLSISPELTLSLSGDEAIFDYDNPKRQTRTLTGRATLTYVLGASVLADAFAGIRVLKDTLVPTERTAETGLRVRWTFRKVEVDPTLEFFDRRRGDTDTKDFRAMLHIIRRF